jgi:aryl-alcohol dehydrogenase-like predicted oxidoreductase
VKLGLGTAQFGMSYGISNRSGQTADEEVRDILRLAAERRIRVIDTAPGYGSSEEAIGRALPTRDREFLIVTKTPQFRAQFVSEIEANLLESTFRESLGRLKCRVAYGLLVHYAKDLLVAGSDLIWNRMKQLKACGLVNKIGVSVYHPAEAEELIERRDLDLIQVPINVLDQRFLNSGCLKGLAQRGVEIHARSVFLQGLLLMNPDDLSNHFDTVKPVLRLFQQFCREQGISGVDAALGFVSRLPEISAVICGVNNSAQLIDLIEAGQRAPSLDFSGFAFEDLRIIVPSLWPAGIA